MGPSTLVPEQPTAQNAVADATVPTAAPAPPPAPLPTPAPAPVPAADRPWISFPPFPQPPPGVELIRFKDFKPLGIHIPEPQDPSNPEPVEVDGLGIPTLTLRVHHDLTAMEKRKRKNNKTKTLPDGSVVLKRWYEEWADGESLRRTSCPIDPSLPRVDRFYQAAYDFKSGRPVLQNQEMNQLLTQYWDKFRIFVGLISSAQPIAARKKHAAMRALAAAQAAAGDDEDDEELDEMPNASLPKRKESTITVSTGGDLPATAGPNVKPTSEYTAEERQHRHEYFREVRDTKMDRFLNDPENVVKVFFSNYASDRGDLHSEKFCSTAPILIDFFLKFLQRNRVFPDIERQLRKAIAVTEQAIKELPHAIFMNRLIPEVFGNGCKQLYGAMNGYNIWADNASCADDDAEDGRAAKKQKTDAATTAPTAANTTTSAIAPDPAAAAEAAVLQAALGGDVDVIAPDVAKMEQELKALGPSAHENDYEWGQGDANAAGGSWGDADAGAWGGDVSDNPFLATTSAADWESGPVTNVLHKLLGPTTLPLTHTTGVVERSTRRIKSVVVPPAPSPSTQSQKQKNNNSGKGALEPAPLHDPEAVECELGAKFAKLTLSAWPAYAVTQIADVQKPQILPDSRGAAILDDGEGAEVAPGPGAPHNPFKDDIVVYVNPEIADKMWIGMSIEGVWVQLARVDPSVPIEVSMEQFNNPWGFKKKADGAPGVPIAPTNIWYMEEVRMVLPSFHTEMTPLPTDQDVFGEGSPAESAS